METKRINDEMNTLEAVNALADGVPAALDVLSEIVQHSEENMWLLDLVTLDSFEIYGLNIFKLFNSCHQNIKETLETIAHIRLGMFPIQKIKQNLNSETPIPFVDKKIYNRYVMGVNQELPASILYSKEYQEQISNSFNKRLGEAPGSGKKPPQPGEEE